MLVAPSASAMRRLLSICDDFASEYSILFNATKSKCMVISPYTRRNVQYCEFVVQGKPMEFVSSYVHLGHLITDNLDDSCDISQRRCDFVGQVNNVLCFFQKLCSAVKYKLFQSYCTSFYGCELWDLACDKMADFCTAWRKGVRRVWNVPPDTHCYILPLLCECLPVYDEVCRRSVNFLRTCVSHSSEVVRHVANYSIFHGRCDSPAGRNALHCMNRYGATLSDVLSSKFESLVWEYATKDISIQHEQSVDLLRECIMIRDNVFTLPDFYTVPDVRCIILYICSLG